MNEYTYVKDADKIFSVAGDEPLDLFIMDKFMLQQSSESISFPAVRLAYIYYTFCKINKIHEGVDAGLEFVTSVNKLIDHDVPRDAFRPTVVIDEALSLLIGDQKSGHHVKRRRNLPLGDVTGCDVTTDPDQAVENACLALSTKLKGLPQSVQTVLFKRLEKITRGQSHNAVWHMLRTDTVSATKFYNALVFGSAMLVSDQRSRSFSEGVRFGVEHECVIKALLEFHVMGGRESICGGLGLLIDPTSGLFGASIDMCFGVEKTVADDLVVVNANSVIFEIKCRYKYLRDKGDPNVTKILSDHDEQSVIDFILSHPIPGVEYRAHGDTPSGREFLVSRDTRFDRKKRSRPGKSPDILKPYLEDLLYVNENETSDVIVFDTKGPRAGYESGDFFSEFRDMRTDSALSDLERRHDALSSDGENDGGAFGLGCEDTPELIDKLCVFEKRRFKLPVFANPRHQYYFQTLIQQYVLSQYYIRDHDNPEYINYKDLPSVNLVTAVLRRRAPEEIGLQLSVGGRSFDCEHVPLFVLITPVVFDPSFTRDAVTTVLRNWQREVHRKTNLSIWVPNAVNEYVASSIPRPRTP